jgi:hypothetical protein
MANRSGELYKNGELSIVRKEPRKMTKKEAGYMGPLVDAGHTVITPDRFCCQNCVRYSRSNHACHIVEGDDIEDRGCCNWMSTELTIQSSQLESGLSLPTNHTSSDIPIEGGSVSSLEAHAIVNGLPKIVIDRDKLEDSFNKLKYGLGGKIRDHKGTSQPSENYQQLENMEMLDTKRRRRKRSSEFRDKLCIIV